MMYWQKEAMRKLQEYEAMRLSLQSLPKEMARLRRAGDMPGYEQLERRLRQAKRWVALVDGAMSVLTPEERLLLHRFFIHPGWGNLDRLRTELNVGQSAVYRRRDKALKKFTIALYGPSES